MPGSTGPAEVLQAYNALAAELYGRRNKEMTKKTGIQVQEFIAWCKEFGLDPLIYMDARIRSTHHASGRLVTIPKLASLKFKDGLYAEWAARRSENRLYETIAQDRIAEKVEEVGPSEGTTPLWESSKRVYAMSGDHEMCRLSFDMTGGWNPVSELCGFCPVAQQCREDLTPKWRAYRDAVQQRIRARLPAGFGQELRE